MPQDATLTPEERALLAGVGRAVELNPFSAERAALDRRLAGARRGEPAMDTLLGRLEALLATLDGRANRARAATREPGDGELLERARLFCAYYRQSAHFDRHIRAQEEAGDSPIPVPFAREALAELARAGFPAARGLEAFAFFFQLRRAYHFIERSLVGRGPSMVALREALWNAVFTADLARYRSHLAGRMEPFATLIVGPTGTGKGAAAAAIGRSGHIPFDPASGRFSESFTRVFVPLNLAGLPEGLFESALFGHVKGAFTGAVAAADGLLARCSPHGSVFLDEIGELAPTVQVKLLDVLQERRFTPVGAAAPRAFRGRLIAATHRAVGPAAMAAGGSPLREDLYYRLCSDLIEVPPLATRLAEAPDELGDLVKHILAALLGAAAEAWHAPILAALERDTPRGHPWPGNVRELEQTVRRLLVRGALPTSHFAPASGAPARADLAAGEPDARTLLGRYCAELLARHGSVAAVARIAALDPRTVRRHLALGTKGPERGSCGP